MLRITVERQVTGTQLILEGRLAGPWVEELRKVLIPLWSDPVGVTINLNAICGMDGAGRELLIQAYERGADLTGSRLHARAFIEEMAVTTSRERLL